MAEHSNKRIALVTGANKGIGYETARRLASQGMTVLLGARDEPRGKEAAAKLQAEGLDVQFLRLDVTDQTTHKAAHGFIEDKFGKLDVLVNNAGIALDIGQKPSEVDMQTLRKTFDTNFFGAVAVTQAFLPLIRKSDAGRIVNVSSGLASLTLHNDPTWAGYPLKLLAYNTSKTALNAFTVTLAYELKDTTIKVNSAEPGYTATDLNGHSGHKTVEQAADVIIQLATLPADGATGGYFDDQGVLPW
ncbi:MAG TPA: SDR family oxidoreductase [Blastocatellia bacterium]|jgi:NAD(P)-dependent dehydrogenase (short-subunit alcohol dehydrogenase family)|nr:SDR family oxidoreductase [Blastocatellia bacterium]